MLDADQEARNHDSRGRPYPFVRIGDLCGKKCLANGRSNLLLGGRMPLCFPHSPDLLACGMASGVSLDLDGSLLLPLLLVSGSLLARCWCLGCWCN